MAVVVWWGFNSMGIGMKRILILYIATFIIMGICDAVWLMVIAKSFYSGQIGSILIDEPRWLAIILFYCMYAFGIVAFVSGRALLWQAVAIRGALFGLIAYGTYDFTNMATLTAWTWPMVIVDMAWGMANTAVSATGGWWICNKINKST